jgi:hypothetical protein
MDRQGGANPISDWVKRKKILVTLKGIAQLGRCPDKDNRSISIGGRDAEAKEVLGHRIITLIYHGRKNIID